MRRRGLGRGLDALLPAISPVPKAEELYRELPAEALEPNPQQPRSAISPADLERLAASIQARGVLEPIVVRECEGRFQIVAGERRWRAARQAGLATVPVVIRSVADRDLGLVALVENLQREDLNPIEEARAFRRLSDSGELTHREIAEEVGRSRSAVSNTLRLLDLAPEVQGLVEGGRLRAGAGRALLPLAAPDQRALAREVVRRNLPVREVERRVKALRASPSGSREMPPGPSDRTPADSLTQDAQKRMQEAVGLPVTVRRRGSGGSVHLRFYTEEDLIGVVRLLTNRPSEPKEDG